MECPILFQFLTPQGGAAIWHNWRASWKRNSCRSLRPPPTSRLPVCPRNHISGDGFGFGGLEPLGLLAKVHRKATGQRLGSGQATPIWGLGGWAGVLRNTRRGGQGEGQWRVGDRKGRGGGRTAGDRRGSVVPRDGWEALRGGGLDPPPNGSVGSLSRNWKKGLENVRFCGQSNRRRQGQSFWKVSDCSLNPKKSQVRLPIHLWSSPRRPAMRRGSVRRQKPVSSPRGSILGRSSGPANSRHIEACRQSPLWHLGARAGRRWGVAVGQCGEFGEREREHPKAWGCLWRTSVK